MQKQKHKELKKKPDKERLPVNGATEFQALTVNPEPTEEPKKDYPSVVIAIARTFKLSLLAGGLYKLAFDVIQFGFPQLLRLLISFVEKGTDPTWYGVVIALTMFLLATIQSLVSHF